ncbi:head-tail connector protein [Aeromonas caviae]|uniref:head-tail connector protein n=1 Tax=Aeromonas caviae TaxID=648 RepID=UPI002B48356D|nr:head-tail connector protein [Aeromonas caviae]
MLSVVYKVKEVIGSYDDLISDEEIQNYLRLPDSEDEISILKLGCLSTAETFLNRPLIESIVTVESHARSFMMPYMPINKNIEIIKASNDDGIVTDFHYSDVSTRVTIGPTVALPVTFTVHVMKGDTTIHPSIKIAVLKMIASEYEMREDAVIGASVSSIPNTSQRILKLYRSNPIKGR